MSKRFRKLSHSLYECKYHIVFCPKYRFRVLEGEIGKYVERQIYILSEQKDSVEIVELNVRKDHVYVVMWAPPKYSISDIPGFSKGKIAMNVFKQFKAIGKQYWGRHLWSRGYCVSTVGIDEEMIRQYVKWQEQQEREIEQRQLNLFD